MSRRFAVASLLAAISLVFAVRTASPGANKAGAVHLSWERGAFVPMIGVPPAPPFPLYIVIEGAPDIQALGVTLRWFPYDKALKIGYDVTAAARADAGCGWSTGVPPAESFQGETYDGMIAFPSGSDKSCITYFFHGPPCDSFPPAMFQIQQLIVQDSRGAFDTLRVTGSAKLEGGPGCAVDGQQDATPAEGVAASGPSVWASPNPAPTGAMELRVYLPVGGSADLSVFDVRGRLVKSLARGDLPAGGRSYLWDLADRQGQTVPNGIYFARLRGSFGTRTTPVVVAR